MANPSVEHEHAPLELKGVRFEITGDSVRNSEHVDAVEAMLRAVGRPDEEASAGALGLQEILANALRHGNGGDLAKPITVEMEMDAQHCEIIVEDESETAFDIDKVPDPLQQENLLKGYGRGVFLARQYFDVSVYHEDVGKRGNRVILRRDFMKPYEAARS